MYRTGAGTSTALTQKTGKPIWSHKVSEYTGIAASFTRNSPAIGPTQIIFGDHKSGYLIAIDKATGNLKWKTLLGPADQVQITASSVIAGGRVYVGVASNQETNALNPGATLTFRGSVVALDFLTGHIL